MATSFVEYYFTLGTFCVQIIINTHILDTSTPYLSNPLVLFLEVSASPLPLP